MNGRTAPIIAKTTTGLGRLMVAAYLISGFSLASCFDPLRIVRVVGKGTTATKKPRISGILFSTLESDNTGLKSTKGRMESQPRKLLVHWRGEGEEGYSRTFRYPEFLGALRGVTKVPFESDPPLKFQNALSYNGTVPLAAVKLRAFNEALQWITLSPDSSGQENKNTFTMQTYMSAVERCALVATLYEVIAEGDSFSELNDKAMENGGFDDMMVGNENEKSTWAVRVRQYGGDAERDFGKERRHSIRARSVSMEKDACIALKPMLLKFGGGVDLENPDCKVFLFDGLDGRKALGRKIAAGPRISVMNPNTRICVTTTPLEPIAAFSLCNIAGIRDGQRIFDPYSGSCAILLAASMIAKNLQQVGVDNAHDGFINRDHIREDFLERGLQQPQAVFQGDSTDAAVRDEARAAVGNEPFDHIITDPPYGVREALEAGAPSPLEELFQAIKEDQDRGKPLLRQGGRLVCFIPLRPEMNLEDELPSKEQADDAGMKLLLSIEQPLNSKLSRWLVSYECIR